MQEDSLGADLLAYLLERPGDDPGTPRTWRMNAEWWQECKHLTDPTGHPLLVWPHVDSGIYLLGFPIEVTQEATVPELVPAT